MDLTERKKDWLATEKLVFCHDANLSYKTKV